MLANFGGWHAVIIILVVLLLFGATKLPALARSMGQSMKIFKNEIKSDNVPDASAPHAEAGQAPAANGTSVSGTVPNAAPEATSPSDGTQSNTPPQH